jgi:hypothetical protein
VLLYRTWQERLYEQDRLTDLVDSMPARTTKSICDGILRLEGPSVYDAYHTATSIRDAPDAERSGRL